MSILLSREEFKEKVFARQTGVCCFCLEKAQDAHHIMERKLWDNGGYYLDNGAGVCAIHHWECEKTTLSPKTVRRACGISTVLLPSILDPTKEYDKWGNIILPSGKRFKGPLFFEENVQKILKKANLLYLFEEEPK